MSRLLHAALVFLLVSVPLPDIHAQSHTISGTVTDAVSGDPLPAATVRLAGSSKGTITNTRGEFQFPLSRGTSLIIISYVGYRSDSLSVADTAAPPFRVRLQPVSIQLQGVTVTDEDPAYEIIRRAIDEKQRWMEQLTTFEGKAFTRMALRSDTSIASITEAYSTLYWSRGDTLREVITQTRKTGNLPPGFRPSTVGAVINFNDNEIRQLGFRFIGPTAPGAFDHYDYKLLRTRKQDEFDVYDIQLIPRSRTTPLFAGRISIAERSYAVMEVDVRPNEAFVIPFIQVNDLRYIQHFRLYETRFWLPMDYRTTGSISIRLAGMTLPAIGMDKDVVVYDYTINPVMADSIRTMKTVSFDSSSNRFDSTFWRQTNVLPLTAEQETAYGTLDSTQTLESKFKPKGAGASVIAMLSNNLFSIAEVHFNRVEGWYLGADKTFGGLVSGLALRGSLGYGMSEKVWNYGAGATFDFGSSVRASASAGLANATLSARQFSIGADVYRKLNLLPEEKPYSFFSNTIAALVSKIDYYDYYQAAGWKTEFTFRPALLFGSGIEYRSEKNRSVKKNTDYAVFARSSHYRGQPAIDDGQLCAVTFSLSYGNQILWNMLPQGLMMNAAVEFSDRDLLRSDFSYTRYKLSSHSKIMTMGSDLLYPQSLSIIASGGFSRGTLPFQRQFDIIAGLGGFGQIGAIRGVSSREFYGDWFYSVIAEHNFRRAPFLWLGIAPLYRTNWEFIVTGSIASTRNSSGIYSEAGFGINNIFDLLRVDLTYRLVAPREVVLSLSLADFLSGLM
jgi:hypothetical protein